ncbi:MAG: type II toxin-antitoxin system HicA family toxin [Sulfuritalea sp.]|nr:type II toxin-antitoxin system HicA family toxin [Sulfuritalea sp.]
MSHKHQHLLRSLFQDPPSANIHWREIESLLHHLGAAIEPVHGARFRVVLNRHEFFLHHPHQSNVFGRQDIKHLREFLARAGVSPSLYEARREAERNSRP